MNKIAIGHTKFDGPVSLNLNKANRHGLVTGATGTGKTVTLQKMAEEFSKAGVPVFAADVKGDLSGICAKGDPDNSLSRKYEAITGDNFATEQMPTQLWDLFGEHGLPIRTSVHEMGPMMLARMLGLNPTQEGALNIAFKLAEDEQEWMLTLDDLRFTLDDMRQNREDISHRYGHITSASIAAIQRNIMAIEAQGAEQLFGEPPFDITDFIRHDDNGRGFVNLLHADQLMEAPKLYAIFLLWLLTRLFSTLDEAGDLDRPRLVFFFDEAHLLFKDAPKPLIDQIERVVRLVRSKGVGVYFVTQSPKDVPDNVLAQLGNRIQHALRAYTPSDQRLIKASANAFRPNEGVAVKDEIVNMGVGEALISVLDEYGAPTPVEKVRVIPPQSSVGPITGLERQDIIDRCNLKPKYGVKKSAESQTLSFCNRMRKLRGLKTIRENESDYKEGDFAKFVPTYAEYSSNKKKSKLRAIISSIGWVVVFYLAAKYLLAHILI